MKRIFLLVLFSLSLIISASAQTIEVKSFQPLTTDLTASSIEGKRFDQNGQVAALIKVVTTETGFSFEGGTLGIVNVQERNGEIWVWVPQKLRKITILHRQFGVLRNYEFPVAIEAERTYEMVLQTSRVAPDSSTPTYTQQYLVFQVNPKNAVLEVNDEIWTVSDGASSKLVDFGTYTYRIQAPDYHTEAGRVTVNDPKQKKIITVNLKPNFGWVEIKGTSAKDADVYIDNAYVGKAPCKSGNLKSGSHSVKIVKNLYETYSEQVTVNDEQTVTLSPTMKANFAHVTLTVDADAEILVNDEKKGVRTWTGDLGTGNYRIECRMASHESTVTIQKIDPRMDGQTIQLTPPTPIYGTLNVESTPNFAKIFIDGKSMGETPNFFPEILIGQHKLKLTKDGYSDFNETVTIVKGERKEVKATMSTKPASTTKPTTTTDPVANNNNKTTTTKPSSTSSNKKTSTSKKFHPIRYSNLMGFALGSGYGGCLDIGGCVGALNKRVGWEVDYNFRGWPDGGYNDGIGSLEVGGGAVFDIVDDGNIIWGDGLFENVLLLYVGGNVGYSFLDYPGVSYVFTTKLEYIHLFGLSPMSGLGLYMEYFTGKYGSVTRGGFAVGLSWSFLNDSWKSY